jgi:hypothetical protein
MAPLGVGATKMVTQRRSTEVVSGASMGRWFQTRGGGIGAGVGVVDNGGVVVELQWRRLWEMETGKGRQRGAAFSEGKKGRWLHGVDGGRHREEQRDS